MLPIPGAWEPRPNSTTRNGCLSAPHIVFFYQINSRASLHLFPRDSPNCFFNASPLFMLNPNDSLRGFSRALYSNWLLWKPDRILIDCGEGCATTLDGAVGAIEKCF